MDQSDWLPETNESPTLIADMDKLITKLQEARVKYDQAKKASGDAHSELELVEKDVINALKTNGRTKFEAEGVALVSIVSKESYTVPKSAEAKLKLFDYIKTKYGDDALTNMISINSNTLNAWANAESEKTPEAIPGLDAPTSKDSLRFMKR